MADALLFRAVVQSSDSTTGQIFVVVPAILGSVPIEVSTIGRKPSGGTWAVPAVGDQIWVTFEDALLTNCVWLGAGSGSGGASDHGDLTGLGDDDHTQYYNTARGDARWAQLSHTHSYMPLSGGNFTGAITVSGSTVWHAGNDGAGSGLDADLLDGLDSAAFASAGHSHGPGGAVLAINDLTDVDTSAFPPSAGSVLTYDTGDSLWKPGAAAGHNHDAAYVNVTGDTMTGALVLAPSSAATLPLTITGAASQSASLFLAQSNAADPYVRITQGGMVWLQGSNTEQLRVKNLGGTTHFVVDTSNAIVQLQNGAKLRGYSDAGTTITISADSATGDTYTVGRLAVGQNTFNSGTSISVARATVVGDSFDTTTLQTVASFGLSAAQAFTGTSVVGVDTTASIASSAGKVPANLIGVRASLTNLTTLTPGAVTLAATLHTSGSATGGAGAIYTTVAGLYVTAFTKSNGAGVTNAYGIYLKQQTAGTNNYQVYSEGGAIRFDAGANTITPLTLRAAASQSAGLLVWQDSGGTPMGSITGAGSLSLLPATLDSVTEPLIVRKGNQSSASPTRVAVFDATGTGTQQPFIMVTAGGDTDGLRLGIGASFTVGYLDGFKPSITKLSFRLQGTEIASVQATNIFVGANGVWHAGNDGSGSGLDADLLDGNDSTYFATAASVSALSSGLSSYVLSSTFTTWTSTHLNPALDPHSQYYDQTRGDARYAQLEYLGGSLLFQGNYSPLTYLGTSATEPKALDVTHPNDYKHGMYWICVSDADVNFIGRDPAGNTVTGNYFLYAGDWIVAIDPLSASYPDTRPWVARAGIVFQVIPYSSTSLIDSRVAAHEAKPDPHSVYLNFARGDARYPQLVHSHQADIDATIVLHQADADPHSQYLLPAEADAAYSTLTHEHSYEPAGSVVFHEGRSDPHPQYLVVAEGDALYAPTVHPHSDLLDRIVLLEAKPATLQNFATDGAQSSNIYFGDTAPVAPTTGDVWITTPNISLQIPPAPSNFTGVSTVSTTVALSWDAWAPAAAIDLIEVDRFVSGVTWTSIFTDGTAPFDTTYSDTGRTENTVYTYRLRGHNAAGYGPYTTINVTAANAAPAAPTGLATGTITSTSIILNWSAVGGISDFLRFDVLRNGVVVGTTTNNTSPTYTYTSLSENVSYTLGVRTVDAAGAMSSITTLVVSSANATPPAPTSPSVFVNSSTGLTLSWVGVSGITDFNSYQVFRNGVLVGATSGTSFFFGGLTPSTAYTLGVRTLDNGSLFSSTVSAGGTTAVNPDSTPPGNASVSTWKPESSYGNMVLRATMPGDADFNFYQVQYSTNGGASWTNWNGAGSASTPGAAFASSLGTFGAGSTVYARINVRDASGNWRIGPAYGYTLLASPYTVFADASNQWRNSGGGQWNYTGDYRPYHGYFSNPTFNYMGMWFYGTKFADIFGASRTFTAVQMYLSRVGCGANAAQNFSFYTHGYTTNPGTVSGWGTPSLIDGPLSTSTALAYSQAAWQNMDLGWIGVLAAGSRRGVAIYSAGGTPYACFTSVSEDAYSGAWSVTHLG